MGLNWIRNLWYWAFDQYLNQEQATNYNFNPKNLFKITDPIQNGPRNGTQSSRHSGSCKNLLPDFIPEQDAVGFAAYMVPDYLNVSILWLGSPTSIVSPPRLPLASLLSYISTAWSLYPKRKPSLRCEFGNTIYLRSININEAQILNKIIIF